MPEFYRRALSSYLISANFRYVLMPISAHNGYKIALKIMVEREMSYMACHFKQRANGGGGFSLKMDISWSLCSEK